MAPKSKAPKTAVKKTAQKSSPTGLQLSSAQWKAYNSAYTASASAGFRRLAIQTAATSLRQSRLSAAYSLGKKAAVSHAAARAAAIAAFATQQSYRQSKLAHQNAALQQRIFADFERHIQLAGRLQFIYKGEAAYLHTGVMRTLDMQQALSITEVRFNQAVKTAKAAARSTTTGGASSAQSSAGVAQVQAAAKAAGLAAAKATPKGRTASRSAKFGPLCNPRAVGMFGDPDGYDCCAAAIASHLDFRTAYRLNDSEYEALVKLLGPAPSIGDALGKVTEAGWPGEYRLTAYAPEVPAPGTRLVAGFATENGPHAALLLSYLLVVSWGETLLLDVVMTPGTQVEESWNLRWEKGTRG